MQSSLVMLRVKTLSKKGNPKVATAYMRRSTDNLSQIAQVLGKMEDSIKYKQLSDKIATVYDRYFISEDGAIESGRQAPYVRALAMNLCSEEKRSVVVKQLVEEIRNNDMCLNTGFLSTPFILPVLVDNGHPDIAFTILEQTKYPSWLHQVELGATTLLEKWGGMDVFEGSFNHYSLGTVCEFLFSYVGGIRPIWDKPGYQEFEIKPIIGGTLTRARVDYNSPYGQIISAWEIENGKVKYEFTVPVNTKAHVTLADGRQAELGSGTYFM